MFKRAANCDLCVCVGDDEGEVVSVVCMWDEWVVSCELWIVYCEFWAVSCELWAVGCELWAVSRELWVVSYERWAVAPHCSKDSVVCKAQSCGRPKNELSGISKSVALPTSPRQKRCSLHAKKREKAKNYWLVNISWWLGRFIKNEEIKFETWTFLDDLVDLSRMRRLSSKQNERMMIEHASRCVFVFYDLLKLLCELLLFKYFKLLKLRNNLHA